MARKDTRKDAVGVKELIGDVDVFAVGKRRRTTKRDLVGEIEVLRVGAANARTTRSERASRTVLKVGRSRENQRRTVQAMGRRVKGRRKNGRSFGEKVADGVGGTVDKAEESVTNIFKDTARGTKRFVDDVEDELGRFF